MTAMRVMRLPPAPRLNWTASFHHLSARASSVSGTVRSSALAVLRLMTSSYLVGACTGRSARFDY
jgi:hypothetical protein